VLKTTLEHQCSFNTEQVNQEENLKKSTCTRVNDSLLLDNFLTKSKVDKPKRNTLHRARLEENL